MTTGNQYARAYAEQMAQAGLGNVFDCSSTTHRQAPKFKRCSVLRQVPVFYSNNSKLLSAPEAKKAAK